MFHLSKHSCSKVTEGSVVYLGGAEVFELEGIESRACKPRVEAGPLTQSLWELSSASVCSYSNKRQM